MLDEIVQHAATAARRHRGEVELLHRADAPAQVAGLVVVAGLWCVRRRAEGSSWTGSLPRVGVVGLVAVGLPATMLTTQGDVCLAFGWTGLEIEGLMDGWDRRGHDRRPEYELGSAWRRYARGVMVGSAIRRRVYGRRA
jgi:hypothetical protein